MSAAVITSDSLWKATADLPELPELHGATTADVCVVGAGIAGLTTAYLLARGGKRVVVVDDRGIAAGQTQMTTAHLSNAIDDRYAEIERLHGEGGSRLAAESHTAAIDQIERIVRDERISCDFLRLDGYLFVPPGESQEVLEKEHEAARRTGVVQVEWVDRAPMNGFDTGRCLRFGQQGQFHPLRYLAGLAEAIRGYGGRLYGGTHVRSVQGGKEVRVEAAGDVVVTASAAVVATNTPINNMVTIHTKQAPYMSYVVGLRIPRGSVRPALFWDTLDPYHYVRLQRDEADEHSDILIVGGEDHKTGQADDAPERFSRLEAWARERFAVTGLEYHWAGQVMETIDGLAFIGRNPGDENVYTATGDSGMGMTHGTIAGMLLTDLILGRENPWASLYDPARKTLRAAKEFAQENLNVAAQYASWLTPGEVSSVEEIEPGQGAILRRGLKKVAAYRDDKGRLIELSAACPHLGCVVAWNSLDQTWDCPCHGSRFRATGEVVNGPANRGLQPINQE